MPPHLKQSKVENIYIIELGFYEWKYFMFDLKEKFFENVENVELNFSEHTDNN